MPSRVATLAAVLGIKTSGVQVATITRSMSAAARPLAASAFPPAATAMSVTVSSGLASRLLSMPTRLRIHSSLVSTVAARSSLVSTFAGWYPPNARIRAPWEPSVSRIGGLTSRWAVAGAVLRGAVLGQQRARSLQVVRGPQRGPGHVRQRPPGQSGQRAAGRQFDERARAEAGHR